MANQTTTDYWTQQQFAELLDCDRAVVARLLSRKILTRGAPWRQWIREIYRHYANDAGGRATKLNLADERAKLAQAQTERIRFELAKERGQFKSTEHIVEAMHYTNAALRNRLLGLPQRLRSQHPEISAKAYLSLDEIVRELLVEVASTRVPPDIAARLKAIDDEDFKRATETPDEPKTGGRKRTPAPKTSGKNRKARDRERGRKTERDVQSVQTTAPQV